MAFTQVSPSCYCIKCIPCCLCFSAVTAVQFPPYELNSKAKTCLEKSPQLCVMLGLLVVPVGVVGSSSGLEGQGQDKGTAAAGPACRREVHSSSMVTGALLHWVKAVDLCSVLTRRCILFLFCKISGKSSFSFLQFFFPSCALIFILGLCWSGLELN